MLSCYATISLRYDHCVNITSLLRYVIIIIRKIMFQKQYNEETNNIYNIYTNKTFNIEHNICLTEQ